jgi:hypothetical protein
MTSLRDIRALSLVVLALCGPATHAGAQSVSPDVQLAAARALYERGDYEAAIRGLDPLIAALEPLAGKDQQARRLLPTAYELRARARFQLGNADGASADFRALLKLAPAYALSRPASPRLARMFDDIRKNLLGTIILNLSPVDAELELDGVPFQQAAGPIPIAIGPHTISGRRPGYRSASLSFSVPPGTTVEVVLTLERVAATVTLVTSPPVVDVLLDGVSQGRTLAGPQPPRWDEPIAKAGLQPGAVSMPFVLEVGPGSHTISFLRDCYVGVDLRAEIASLTDKFLAPVKLDKALAESVFLTVGKSVGGATVILDGELKGRAPLLIEGVCEGLHLVELRSPWGRYAEKLTVRAGDRLTVAGTLKPAVAVLSVNGLPRGYLGTDLRVDLERRFLATMSMTLFAPPQEKVQQALQAERLQPGWLAFDGYQRPIGATSAAVTPSARLQLGSRLAKALEAQGVAELTARPGGNRSEFLLSILADGSSEPDVLELALDDPASVNNVIERLDKVPPLYRASAGVRVIDALDVAGAVVVNVDAAATRSGLGRGDVITKVDGQPVNDGASFNALVALRRVSDTLSIEARDQAGTVKTAQLAVTTVAPRLIAMSDQSLLFNNLILVLRTRLATSGPNPDPIVRLNLAVALMRLRNYAEARAELAKIKLEPGPGVSGGTVHFLLGLCHETLGSAADAEREWRLAEQDSESLLTENGPFISDLAKEKLARLKK